MEGLKGSIDTTAGRLLFHIVWYVMPFGNQLSRFLHPQLPPKLKKLGGFFFFFFAIIFGFLSEIPEKILVFVYLCLLVSVNDSLSRLAYLVGTQGSGWQSQGRVPDKSVGQHQCYS